MVCHRVFVAVSYASPSHFLTSLLPNPPREGLGGHFPRLALPSVGVVVKVYVVLFYLILFYINYVILYYIMLYYVLWYETIGCWIILAIMYFILYYILYPAMHIIMCIGI